MSLNPDPDGLAASAAAKLKFSPLKVLPPYHSRARAPVAPARANSARSWSLVIM